MSLDNLKALEAIVERAMTAGKELIKEVQISQESVIIALKMLHDVKEENDRIIARYEAFIKNNESGSI